MSHLMTRFARLRDERGFTMVYVMLFMLVGSLFAVAAWTSANSDIAPTQTDKDSKAAYAAAESGLNYYLFQLNQDNGFWTDCAGGATLPNGEVNPVNPRWDGTGADPRRFRPMPGSTTASYAIEPMPVGAPPAQCVVGAGAAGSMLNSNGDLTIRSTGRVGTTKRTVVGSLTRAGFLDYLYFTDKETLDPVVYQGKLAGTGKPTNCDVYRRDGRNSACTDIVFANNDFVKGPFHTNDNFLACGQPTFGRNLNDKIEASDPAGWASGCGPGSGNPKFLGDWQKGVATLQLPPTNTAIKDSTQGAYSFKGITKITMSSSNQLTVTNAGTTKTLPWPSNGVVYVDTDTSGGKSCGLPYDLVQDYDDLPQCADVYVHGSYAKSLTIATARDIIVDGNITRSGNPVLGLIADNFVRVYHPVTPASRSTQTCTANAAGSPSNISIDAAMLALNHSFIVDNYYCGAPLGTLTVNGAIGQHFRGPVGTGGTSIATGYWKNYNYDDRLRKVNPPYFLDPVNSAWKLDRFNEQIPAT
jgi:hypothetical protein